MKVELEAFTDSGETTNEITNEDYIWKGPEKGLNSVLLLDGTSGTTGDFGADGEKTGGRIYVETIAESVEKQLTERPDKDPQKALKDAVRDAWEAFEDKGVEERQNYFSGEEATVAEATTVPGAVGALVTWNSESIELMHVGDVESYIVLEDRIESFSNEVHQRFDGIMNEKITELRSEGVEDPEKRPEVRELCNSHRASSNYPGTYPQISFNPLAVEKGGARKTFERGEVEKIILSSDGATPRMRRLFELGEEGLIDFLEDKGVEEAVRRLREKEDEIELDELKNSDDAAVAVIKF